jgi:DNA-binding IclR family transcriptional regulator
MTGTRRTPRDRKGVEVIARAAAIMRALEGEPRGLSLGKIAQRAALPRATVQRIVVTLKAEKFVIDATPRSEVRLGPALLRLAGSVRTDFVTLIRPFLFRLSRELHETVVLSLIKGNQVVAFDQVVGPERLRTVSAIGESLPLHCTAGGKAYLSLLDDAEVAGIVGCRLDRLTEKTLATLAALLTNLDKVRKLGVAFDSEEHEIGVHAAGIALQDVLGNYVTISVPVPVQRFPDREQAIAQRLVAARREIEGCVSARAA